MKKYFTASFFIFVLALIVFLYVLQPKLRALLSAKQHVHQLQQHLDQHPPVTALPLTEPMQENAIVAFIMQTAQNNGFNVQTLQPITASDTDPINRLRFSLHLNATATYSQWQSFINGLNQAPFASTLNQFSLQSHQQQLQIDAELITVLCNRPPRNLQKLTNTRNPFAPATKNEAIPLERSDLIKKQQEELQWQALSLQTAPLHMRIWQIHYARAEDIGRFLQDSHASFLSPRGHVNMDTRTNIICIQDVDSNLTVINQLIARLDVPVQQVLIEARLVSIDNQFERQLGLHFSSATGLALATLRSGTQWLDIQLTALENAGHGEIISTPSLFTANQKTAAIESGEEIPYQEVSRSGATSVAFKKAVLSLKVTPQIMPNKQILLELQINQDKPSSHQVLGVPTISTHQITTNIMVQDGHIIVLGGIYETNNEQNQQRIPFLGKIPLVGLLFKQQNSMENKRELLIFVTPKIIFSQVGKNYVKTDTKHTK